MQISKLMPAICAVAVCAGLISVRAQDNPAQAAARAALLEKMGELDAADGRPPAIIVTPAGATVEKPTPPTIQTPPPAPTLPVTDTNAMSATTAEAQRQAAQAKKEAAQAAKAQAKKDAALARQKKAEEAAQLQNQTAEANAAKLEKQKIAGAEKQRAAAEKAAAAGKGSEPTPIDAPPLPISAAKQQQLDGLLLQYKADRISPSEYQTQRAAILAQP
jgi:hypothetical protein